MPTMMAIILRQVKLFVLAPVVLRAIPLRKAMIVVILIVKPILEKRAVTHIKISVGVMTTTVMDIEKSANM